jgi:hypothetical protein
LFIGLGLRLGLRLRIKLGIRHKIGANQPEKRILKWSSKQPLFLNQS